MCISKLSGQVVSARRSFVLQSLSGQLARWIDSCTNSNIIRLTCPLSFTYCNSQHTKAMHRGDYRVPSPFGGKHVRGAHIRSPIYSLPFATHSSNNHATNFQTYISTFSDDQEMPEMLPSLHLPPGWSQGQPQGQPRTRPCSGQSSPKRWRRIQVS